MERCQINLRVDPEELGDWVRQSGEAGLSLSEWVRRRCNQKPIVSDKILREVRETTKAHIQQQVLLARTGKCPHHKMRGELCYKCDAKFGMPKVEG